MISVTSKPWVSGETENLLQQETKGPPMNSTVLLRKLIAIERSIGKIDNNTLRNLVFDAEDYLIQMQKERADSFLAGPLREGVVQLNLLRQAS